VLPVNTHPEQPKPIELTRLASDVGQIFEIVREAFGTPPELVLDLRSVESVSQDQMTDATEVACILLRKLQLLNFSCRAGVLTTNQSVILLLSDILQTFKALKSSMKSETWRELHIYLNRFSLAIAAVGEQESGGGIVYLR
jgi:hypothetical protein